MDDAERGTMNVVHFVIMTEDFIKSGHGFAHYAYDNAKKVMDKWPDAVTPDIARRWAIIEEKIKDIPKIDTSNLIEN